MDIKLSDFPKICRLCLGIDKQMKCLFPEASEELHEMEEIRKMIDALIVYPVSKSDNLPNNICSKCIDQIQTTHNFKNQCERSFELLASMLETYKLGLKNETDHILDELLGSEETEKNVKSEDAFEYMETMSNDGEFNCTYCAKSFTDELDCNEHCGSSTKTPAENIGRSGNSSTLCFANIVETLDWEGPQEDKKPYTSDDDNDDTISDFNTEQPGGSGASKSFESETESNECVSPEGRNTDDKQFKDEEDASTKKDHKCDICNKTFKRLSTWNQHKTTHCKQKPFMCKICNKSFSRGDRLNMHQLRYHYSPSKPAHKNFSSADFSAKHQCDYHGNESPPKSDHKCDICDKSFSNSSNLKQHKTTHSELKCKICNKGFSLTEQLKVHQLKCHKVKPHVCSECGHGFWCAYSLRMHQLDYHQKDSPLENPNKCDICNKTFKNLAKHKRTHLKEIPFVCKVCNKGFTLYERLKAHQTIHQNITSNACPDCGKTFTRSADMRRHQTRYHEIPLHPKTDHTCDICHQFFILSSNLELHKLTHLQFECKICDDIFSSAKQLEKHELEHHKNDSKSQKDHNSFAWECNETLDSKEDLAINEKMHTFNTVVQNEQQDYLKVEIKEEY